MFSMENQSFRMANARERSAPAVGRAMRVVDEVAASSRSLGISEIARRTGLGKSTVHGLVAALVEEGVLTSGDSKGYRLGPRLLELGMRARDQHLRRVAESELERLAQKKGETVLFGRLAGDRVLILVSRESARPLNLSVPIGSSVPALAGALGKAYLASIPEEAATAYLARSHLQRYTDTSITEVRSYLDGAAAARGAGYATERGEYLPGITAVASAFSWLGETYLVWAIGIDANYRDDELWELGEAIRETAQGMLRHLTDTVEAERSAS